jgi:hypothetical protein
MWLFITAVFLVVVWLLYKRPEQTKRVLVGGLFIVLGPLGLFACNQAEQAEFAKVAVTASYDDASCTKEKPLHIVLNNGSSKTANAITWDLEAYVPGHKTNLVDGHPNYKSDTILKPNQFVSYLLPSAQTQYQRGPDLA